MTKSPEIAENIITVDKYNVTLGCNITGRPKSRIKWTKNDVELAGGQYSIIENGDLVIRLVLLNA